ncbi:MAG TPA: CRISPR-associated endonuclease Cas2 [Accumulibacter sp.]|nr:CRISPR-associated endonuclease Cas2 [Accumulibacter sp.]HMW17068.1 CRISPR-associated endonuclease Cas2 [Accumulibacter sp.]HNC18213.1 CRISPR-associated endonuclease Cas2 [Accumulibacter sp.]HND79869.1 CRISPR-associated endonuclease Cas2 [Accumulibacter sp.]HNE12263.1 CRISPR-associated endonuclease Cas2 [Accumulibacter sp.]
MKSPRFWYASYDIAEPGRLRRIAKLLLQHGVRVQKSLYLCAVSAEQIEILYATLARLHHAEEDRLMLSPLCRRCRTLTRTQGMGGHPDYREPFWIF